jgi:small neutral amino acid transporter SnatA (MarC family)
MNTTTHESTYAMLVRSEERSRTVLEIVLYAFFIMSAVFSIWQFAQQTFRVPANGFEAAPCVTCSGDALISSPS